MAASSRLHAERFSHSCSALKAPPPTPPPREKVYGRGQAQVKSRSRLSLKIAFLLILLRRCTTRADSLPPKGFAGDGDNGAVIAAAALVGDSDQMAGQFLRRLCGTVENLLQVGSIDMGRQAIATHQQPVSRSQFQPVTGRLKVGAACRWPATPRSAPDGSAPSVG